MPMCRLPQAAQPQGGLGWAFVRRRRSLRPLPKSGPSPTMSSRTAFIDGTEPSGCGSMDSRSVGTALAYTPFPRQWLFGQRRNTSVPGLLLRQERLHQIFHLVCAHDMLRIIVDVQLKDHAESGAFVLQEPVRAARHDPVSRGQHRVGTLVRPGRTAVRRLVRRRPSPSQAGPRLRVWHAHTPFVATVSYAVPERDLCQVLGVVPVAGQQVRGPDQARPSCRHETSKAPNRLLQSVGQ